MNSGTSLKQRIKEFFRPTTQNERTIRNEQIRNTVLFTTTTVLLVYFRKSLEQTLVKLAENN